MRKQRDITWLIGWAGTLLGVLMLGLLLLAMITGSTPQLRTQNGVSLSLVPADMSVGALFGQSLAAVFSLMVGFFCLREK